MADESDAERMRRPDPDPTLATVALIKESIKSVRETNDIRIDAMDKAQTLFREDLTRVPTGLDKGLKEQREYFEARLERLSAVDEHSKAERLMLLANLNDAIAATKLLHQADLRSLTETVSVFKQTVNERFQLGDIQTEKAARDVKSAVDAAFAAAKEAVGEQNKSNALAIAKSETGFTKQIDQLAESVKSIVKNTDDKIGDLKDRLVAIENRASEGSGKAKGGDESWKNVALIAAIVISLAAVIVPMLERAH